MQSQPANPPLEPWTNPRFYLWLFVIGAIIYNSITYANVAVLGDFFGYFIYYVLATLWYKFAFKYSFAFDQNQEDPETDAGKNNIKFGIMSLINLGLTISIFGASLWAIQNMMDAGVFVISAIFATLIGAVIYGFYVRTQINNDEPGKLFKLYKSTISALFKFDYAALSLLFPISLIYTNIVDTNAKYADDVKNAKTQTVNDKPIPSPLGQQIVYGSTLSILMLSLVVYWWKFRNTVQLDKPIGISRDDSSTWLNWLNIFPLDFFKAFPLIEYAKYVANGDLVELAKKVSMVGLLAYIAYMIVGVYIQKKPMIPCADSSFSFSSCFKSPFPVSNDVPFVNLLVWTLVLCSVVNLINWIIDLFVKQFFPQAVSSTPPLPAGIMEKMTTLFKLVLFPFYWFATLVAQYPIASVVGFMVFAAMGLFLYRSSFDLNDFVQGQKGTVATTVIMLIASLAMYGVYYMNSSTADMAESSMSYGQLIGKTGLGIAVTICLLGIIMYFLNSHSKLVTIVGIVEFGITALIYITGIAFVIGLMRTLFSSSRKMGSSMFQVSNDPESNWVINVLKLFANFLFYLPCLMLDFVDMLKEQYKLTTSTSLLLLAAQAAFILIGRFLPSFVARAINHTGLQILSAPVSMTTSVPITTHDIQFVNTQGDIVVPVSSSQTKVNLKNYSYGVSAWFYIHPQPPTTNANYFDADINLMKLGDFGPSIQFSPKNNTLKFTLYGKPIELNKEVLTVSDVALQTWNNVIINSDNGKIDIFINNTLIYTGNIVPNNDGNAKDAVFNVVVGQADGVHGEMCNVVLNTEPFTKPELMWLYKTNKALNPPVVGVDMDPDNQGTAANDLAAEAVNKNTPAPTSMPAISTSGATTFGIIGAVLGAIFGWLFNDENTEQSIGSIMQSTKGFLMGAVVFGLIGALLGAMFSTDGTVAYILKTIANVFVDTF